MSKTKETKETKETKRQNIEKVKIRNRINHKKS